MAKTCNVITAREATPPPQDLHRIAKRPPDDYSERTRNRGRQRTTGPPDNTTGPPGQTGGPPERLLVAISSCVNILYLAVAYAKARDGINKATCLHGVCAIGFVGNI